MLEGPTLNDSIASGFLLYQKLNIDLINRRNEDPGDLLRIKLNEQYRRVYVGLVHLLKSLDVNRGPFIHMMPAFITEHFNMRELQIYEYWNTTKKRLIQYSVSTAKDLTPSQRANIDIWKGDYALLVWELDIRKSPETITGKVSI